MKVRGSLLQFCLIAPRHAASGSKSDIVELQGTEGKAPPSFRLEDRPLRGRGQIRGAFLRPGGCDNPANERLTFISGDKAYQVVGEEEILSGRSRKQRYVRCSRDPGEIRPECGHS